MEQFNLASARNVMKARATVDRRKLVSTLVLVLFAVLIVNARAREVIAAMDRLLMQLLEKNVKFPDRLDQPTDVH